LEKYVINGGHRLCGQVTISGAKNAAVAILPATLLVDGVCRIENVPHISDVDHIISILAEMGASVKTVNKYTLEIDCSHITTHVPSVERARKMRASYYLVGALLGRYHEARVSLPGGCDLGPRPIDQHQKGMRALGAEVKVEHGMITARAQELVGDSIYLDVVSVGATINIMLAAVLAKGRTVIENAAREPHIVDVANFLNAMGADIRGAGTDTIKITGVERMRGGSYAIIPDQIEAGTYMVAAAATGGNVLIRNVITKHMESITAKLEEIGVEVTEFDESIRIRSEGPLHAVKIKTQPYPGFPTDMQPQMAVLLSLAQGTSIINEGVWDNRYRYVDELKLMSANLTVDGKICVIEGVDHLTAAKIKACDLRAGAAMIIAGLAARGTTEIEDIYHIERGYEDVVEKLRALGADIRRISRPDESELEKAN